MSFGDIAFSLILTVGAYCVIPLTVANFWKKTLSKKKYGVICFIGEAVIAIAFQYWRTSTDVSGGSFSPAILWGLVFYNVGLVILRKRGMLMDAKSKTTFPATPPAQSTVPQPSAEPEEVSAPTSEPSPAPQAAPAKPDTPLSITETWYTCPSCGCLLPTGEVCACGYHPQAEAPAQPQAPVKKRRLPIIVIAVLAIALACSVFYNVEQSGTNAQLSNDLSDAQFEITAKQQTIDSLSVYKSNAQSYINAVSSYADRACVVSSGSNRYHRDPTCTYCDLSYFWIYNVEFAISRGYSQCPLCSALSAPVAFPTFR